MDKNSKNFLVDYLKTYTPSGEEELGNHIWNEEAYKYADDVIRLEYENTCAFLYADLKKRTPKTIVLEAHVDEISWRISNIEENGIIRVVRNGGSDSMIAPSKTGIIHVGKFTKIKGVFGFPAIHVREENGEIKPKDLMFDTGYTKKELLEKDVHVGQIITFDDEPIFLGDKYISGRALDNKLGGFIILEVLKRLKQENYVPNNHLVFANCISEEVGLYGAKLLPLQLKKLGYEISDALVVDVTHHTDTDTIEKSIEGEVLCGSGAVIEHSAQCHKKIKNIYTNVAKENGFKFQHAIGSFGNDTVSFYEHGIPTSILAIPLKYMHTTVETAHLDDVESIIKIFIETIKVLDNE